MTECGQFMSKRFNTVKRPSISRQPRYNTFISRGLHAGQYLPSKLTGMKNLGLLVAFCFISFGALAQAGVIDGTVVDRKNAPVSNATVELLNAADSSVMKTASTDRRGSFAFKDLSQKTYLIRISAIGFDEHIGVPLTIDGQVHRIILPAIVLSSGKSEELQQVVVEAKKPLIELHIDKTVVNVQSMITASTSNTLEVLQRVPGVSVDQNGGISLNGVSGALVLIDGRATYMSSEDLAAYLKSLPGGLLDKIELMDNPPARYDASGGAIINIKLKKNRQAGVTGNVAVGYSQGTYARNNNSVNLNYHRKKVNIFSNLGFSNDKTFNTDLYDRRLYDGNAHLDSKIELKNHQVSNGNGINANIGVDLNASERTTFGVVFNYYHGKKDAEFDYTSKTFDEDFQPESFSEGMTAGDISRTHIGASLNMQHKFNKSEELSAEVTYIDYESDDNRFINSNYFKPGGRLDSADQFTYVLPSTAAIYVAKADYVKNFKNNGKFEAGVKSSFVTNDNLNNYYSIDGIDNNRSNHYKYRENINAAYVNGQKTWGRFGMQLGFRAEHTEAEGDQLGNDQVAGTSFKKSYVNFFPGVFFSYKLDSNGKDNMSFAITRRIHRPNYQMMNPFLFFRDQYTYTSGNPLLTPQFQYRFELKYQHRQWLNTGLSYNRFEHTIFPTTRSVDGVFINMPENVGKGYMVILNTSVNAPLAKWWQLNTTVRLARLGLDGRVATEKLNPNINVARVEVMNYFTIAKGLNAELGGYYASADLSGQAISSGMYRLNAAVQKKIFKDKGAIKLGVDDMFGSWVYKNRSVSVKQAQYYETSFSDTQRFSVGFTYRFGKEKFARKRRTGSGSSEERGRLD